MDQIQLIQVRIGNIQSQEISNHSNRIHSLHFAQCSFSEVKIASEIADAISKSDSLIKLRLEYMKLGKEEIEVILEGLLKNQ
jgi:phage terminase Nu1 subunit (DNA packaging protein)